MLCPLQEENAIEYTVLDQGNIIKKRLVSFVFERLPELALQCFQ